MQHLASLFSDIAKENKWPQPGMEVPGLPLLIAALAAGAFLAEGAQQLKEASEKTSVDAYVDGKPVRSHVRVKVN